MKLSRFHVFIFVVCIVQLACYAPTQSYSDSTPIPHDVQIPSLTTRGVKYSFIIETKPNITCYAGIAFWNNDNDWTFDELPKIQADGTGKCEWVWEVPNDAKQGDAEFRGYVKNNAQRTDFVPKAFCIEVCSTK